MFKKKVENNPQEQLYIKLNQQSAIICCIAFWTTHKALTLQNISKPQNKQTNKIRYEDKTLFSK